MPCVNSYPKVNELFKAKNNNFMVIGIDHKLSDTVNMDQFLKRFNIDYPVIVGELALEIKQKLNINGWPTFVIVDLNGKILEYHIGHSVSFFKKIEKTYLKKR